MVLDCAAGDCRDSAIYLRRRRSGDAPVELAAAATVRLADAWFLASVGTAGTVPDSVWWSGPWCTGRRTRPPLPRALQEHVAGGAGKVSPCHSNRLRLRPDRGEEFPWLRLRRLGMNCQVSTVPSCRSQRGSSGRLAKAWE